MTRAVRRSRSGGLRRCKVLTDQITDHSRATEACPNMGLRPDPLVEFSHEWLRQAQSYLLGCCFHIVLMSCAV